MILTLLVAIGISTLVFPIYLVILLIFAILKTIIQLVLKLKYWSKLKLLKSADTYWAVGEQYHNLSYVLFVVKNKPNSDITEAFKSSINEKLLKHVDKFPKVSCSLHQFLGYPFLLKETFQPDDFVTVIDVEKTAYTSIKDIHYELGSKPLPANGKVLWEIIIIKAPALWKQKQNFREDQIPIILRINHCFSDGLSLMNLIANCFGDDPVDFTSYLNRIPKTNNVNNFSKILLFFRGVFIFFITPGWIILEQFHAKLNRKFWKSPSIVFRQNIAFKSEPLGGSFVEVIKSLKREVEDTGFIEILMAAISASLHKHFQQNASKVSDSLLLLCVATKDFKPMTTKNTPVLRNQFGMLNFELPLKMSSNLVLDRLQCLKANIRPVLKSPAYLVNNFIYFNLMGLFPVHIIKHLFPMAESAGVSNIPGFPKIIICNGYEIENVYFFLPQRDTNGIGFSILTYDNRLHVGLTADEAVIPSRTHCEAIVRDIFRNIELLNSEVSKKIMESSLQTVAIDVEKF